MKAFFLRRGKYQFSHLFLCLFLIPFFFPTKESCREFIVFTNLPLISFSSTVRGQFALLTLQLCVNAPNSVRPMIRWKSGIILIFLLKVCIICSFICCLTSSISFVYLPLSIFKTLPRFRHINFRNITLTLLRQKTGIWGLICQLK